MQLKELLRIKSISLQCRCFAKEVCHLSISKVVVVIFYCVASVVKVVRCQKMSFSDGSSVNLCPPSCSPSCLIGNVYQQNSLATFCGGVLDLLGSTSAPTSYVSNVSDVDVGRIEIAS
jgi:hypothetical protein